TPAGTSGIDLTTAPSFTSCASVNKPAETSACPYGVSLPAYAELKAVITRLRSSKLLTLRPNWPTARPGRTSPRGVVPRPPSPFRSVPKKPCAPEIAPPRFGTVRVIGGAVRKDQKL